jgi:hypothetical protein
MRLSVEHRNAIRLAERSRRMTRTKSLKDWYSLVADLELAGIRPRASLGIIVALLDTLLQGYARALDQG